MSSGAGYLPHTLLKLRIPVLGHVRFSDVGEPVDENVTKILGHRPGDDHMIQLSAEPVTRSRLAPFGSAHAPVIASWVRSARELRFLAPSTPPPLTGQKVREWVKPFGRAFVLLPDGLEGAAKPCNPLGYAELNPMRGQPDHQWIGHVVIDPHRRGRGLGRALLDALVRYAFQRLRAKRISLVVFPENTVAARCYASAGFSMIREERHRFTETGPKRRLLRFEMSAPPRKMRLSVAGAKLVAIAGPCS